MLLYQGLCAYIVPKLYVLLLLKHAKIDSREVIFQSCM